MNIPNVITLVRIVLVPALIVSLLRGNFGTALWIFAVAGISDALDGFIAKRFGLCTRLGSFLDPLADKLLVVGTVLVLAGLGDLPIWLAAAIIGRDLVIVAGAAAFYLRTGELEMDPSLASKFNTCVQLLLIFAVLLLGSGVTAVAGWLPLLWFLALATTIVSGVQYVVVWGGKARAAGREF